MKRILTGLFLMFTFANFSYAEEIALEMNQEKSTQVIEMQDNKINVIVMKQPLNEKSNQKIVLKRNWLGVYVQINGKVKVSPLTHTYVVE